MKKIIMYILLGLLVYVAICAISLGVIYTVEGDETCEFLRDYWSWYSKMFLV